MFKRKQHWFPLPAKNIVLVVMKEGKAKAGEHSYKDVLAKQERLVASLKDLIVAEEHGKGNIRELNRIMEEEQENDLWDRFHFAGR